MSYDYPTRAVSDSHNRLTAVVHNAYDTCGWPCPRFVDTGYTALRVRETGAGPPQTTARSSASTAPWPTAGCSNASTPANASDGQLCQHGFTSTTTTGPTPQSAKSRSSAA